MLGIQIESIDLDGLKSFDDIEGKTIEVVGNITSRKLQFLLKKY